MKKRSLCVKIDICSCHQQAKCLLERFDGQIVMVWVSSWDFPSVPEHPWLRPWAGLPQLHASGANWGNQAKEGFKLCTVISSLPVCQLPDDLFSSVDCCSPLGSQLLSTSLGNVSKPHLPALLLTHHFGSCAWVLFKLLASIQRDRNETKIKLFCHNERRYV